MLRLQLPAQAQRLLGLTTIVTQGTREHILLVSQKSESLSGDALCALAPLSQRDPASSPCCRLETGSCSQGCTGHGRAGLQPAPCHRRACRGCCPRKGSKDDALLSCIFWGAASPPLAPAFEVQEDRPGAVPGARWPGAAGAGAAGARVCAWNPRTALPGSAAAGPAPACRVSRRIGRSSSPALWTAFGRGPQQAGLLLALSGN